MKKKGVFSGFLVFLIVLGISAGIICYTVKQRGNFVTTTTYYTQKGESVVRKQNTEYIAALYIEGTIEEENRTYNQKWLLSTIDAISNDDKNLGMVIYINSPGGSVYQTDEVYLALKDYTASGRKVYIYQGPVAASGGYYISCAGTKIYANRNTMTGSIGVIAGQTFDITQLLEKAGIKSETIHAGKNKNMGNYNEVLTDEQRAILQSVADECYIQFTSIVAKDRNISIDDVQKLADGRIYTAKQAKELKLIDKIDSWDNMLKDFKKNEIQNPDCKVIDFRVPQNNSFFNFMNRAQSAISDAQLASKLGIPMNVVTKMNSQMQYPAFIYEN